MKGLCEECNFIKLQEVITGRRTIKDKMIPASFMQRCSFFLGWNEVLDASAGKRLKKGPAHEAAADGVDGAGDETEGTSNGNEVEGASVGNEVEGASVVNEVEGASVGNEVVCLPAMRLPIWC